MGLDYTSYVIFGWKFSDRLEKELGREIDWEESPELFGLYEGNSDTPYRIISDNMAGEYTYFGIVLSRLGVRGDYEADYFEMPDLETQIVLSIDCLKLLGFSPKEPPKLIHFIRVS